MAKQRPPTTGGFKKGDPRINRKGRPRSMDTLKKLAQQISHEPIMDDDGHPVIEDNGEKLTVIKNMLRSWAFSDVPSLQMKFVEIAFGKVKETVEVNSTNTVTTPLDIHIFDGLTYEQKLELIKENTRIINDNQGI